VCRAMADRQVIPRQWKLRDMPEVADSIFGWPFALSGLPEGVPRLPGLWPRGTPCLWWSGMFNASLFAEAERQERQNESGGRCTTV